LISQAFGLASPEVVGVEILQKGLADIGQAWYTGQSSVQQEHFASALAVRRLHALIAAAPPHTRPGHLLAACPPGEEHDFALLLVSFLLRRHGWNVVYLGANVPLLRLESTLKAASTQVVVSASQTLPSAASLRDLSLFLGQRGIPCAYGGGVFVQFPSLAQAIAGYYLGDDLSTTPARLEYFLSTRPLLPPAAPIREDYRQALEQYRALRPAIEISLSEFLRGNGIPAAQVEHANALFGQYLGAALALGNIKLLEGTAKWLAGLLANYGLSPELAHKFVLAYQQTILDYVDQKFISVFNWQPS